ncbi:GNAT family N-acetyltransferase [Pirellulaceae bacterium SH449]
MIETERLTIRAWEATDAESFFSLTKDSGFMAYLITDYRQPNVDAAATWIRTQRGKYAVQIRETHELIGMGGLTPWTWNDEPLVDITYRLRKSAWGKGYGWELASSLKDYAFRTLLLDQITATITPDNAPSRYIAEKLGFRLDCRITLHGVPTDLYRVFRDGS